MFVKLKSDFMGSASGKVLDVPESEGKLLIEKGIADPQGDEVLSPIVAKAMETAMGKVTDSVHTVIEATLKQFQAAQEQSRKNSRPMIFGDSGEGDPKKNFGDWLSHAIKAITGKPKDAREAEDHLEKVYKQSTFQQKAALGESSGVTGGYTVPTQFYDQIQTLIAEES